MYIYLYIFYTRVFSFIFFYLKFVAYLFLRVDCVVRTSDFIRICIHIYMCVIIIIKDFFRRSTIFSWSARIIRFTSRSPIDTILIFPFTWTVDGWRGFSKSQPLLCSDKKKKFISTHRAGGGNQQRI